MRERTEHHHRDLSADEHEGVRLGLAPWVPKPTLSVLPGQAVSAQVRGVTNQPISGTGFAEHLLPALPSARLQGPQMLHQTHTLPLEASSQIRKEM